MFDTEWNTMNFNMRLSSPKIASPRPSNLGLMISSAQMLAKHFDYVRIDLYSVSNKMIVGELTYTHGGGANVFTPNEWDKKLGDLWILV